MNTVKAWVAIGHMIAIIDINSVENNVPAQIVLAHQKLYVCKCNPPHPLFFAHYTNIFWRNGWISVNISARPCPWPPAPSDQRRCTGPVCWASRLNPCNAWLPGWGRVVGTPACVILPPNLQSPILKGKILRRDFTFLRAGPGRITIIPTFSLLPLIPSFYRNYRFFPFLTTELKIVA